MKIEERKVKNLNIFCNFAAKKTKKDVFKFKQFGIEQELCAMKVGTDGVMLGAWAHGGKSILDVGTGTGIIALMMAQRYPTASVTAIDLDEGAVRQALLNSHLSPFSDRVRVLHESVQEHQGLYDAVVSNPPYFVDALQAPDGRRNMARHAGTLTYGELMQAAWRLLDDDGELSVVVPFDYCRRMEDEAVFQGFFPSRVCAVQTVSHKPPRRYLLAFRKHPCERVSETMALGDERYKALTQDFYL